MVTQTSFSMMTKPQGKLKNMAQLGLFKGTARFVQSSLPLTRTGSRRIHTHFGTGPIYGFFATNHMSIVRCGSIFLCKMFE